MKKILIPIIIALCILCGGYYIWTNLESDIYHSSEFPSNTTINGVDCSKMTVAEAKAALTSEWNSHYVTFKSEDSILGSIKLSGVTYDIEDALKSVRKDFFVNTAMNHVFGAPLDLSVDMTVDKCGPAFDKALKDASYLQEVVITKTENAYIDLNDPKLSIVEEVYGNNVDYDLLKEEVFNLVAEGTFGFQYVKSEFYEQPEILADSEELLERQEFYKENLTCNVTYILGKNTATIPPSVMAEIRDVKISKNGPLTDDEIKEIKKAVSDNVINEDVIQEYVLDFAKKYNTFGETRKFRNSNGKIVKVVGGNYGFALDQPAECEQLVKDLTKGTAIKREPLWLMTGFTTYDLENDIGNTYVEISIKKQHLWYYKDGKKIVDCDVVTGNPYMGYDTPTGTYALSYKQLGATLRGEEADGSEYESQVTYWMPFYGNYGMHDATWRSYFGDEIYLGGGSHGCVNMPYEAAKKVFENIADNKTPIVIY